MADQGEIAGEHAAHPHSLRCFSIGDAAIAIRLGLPLALSIGFLR
jgi:hypothetical protein